MRTTLLAALLLTTTAHAMIIEERVTYTQGDTELTGYLYYDDAKVSKADPAPGVLVVHEWYGLNDYAKRRAKMLAEEGYVAFAADIYGLPEPATNGQEAGRRAGKYYNDRDLFRARVKAGLDTLAEQPECDAEHLGAIGYCFGGTAVLELARVAPNLDAAVSFHGGLANPNPQDDADIRASILICHGAVDPHVSPDDVSTLLDSFEKHGVDYVFSAFAHAKHGFTNPGNADAGPDAGVNYVKEADERSWSLMEAFFEEKLGPGDNDD